MFVIKGSLFSIVFMLENVFNSEDFFFWFEELETKLVVSAF